MFVEVAVRGIRGAFPAHSKSQRFSNDTKKFKLCELRPFGGAPDFKHEVPLREKRHDSGRPESRLKHEGPLRVGFGRNHWNSELHQELRVPCI